MPLNCESVAFLFGDYNLGKRPFSLHKFVLSNRSHGFNMKIVIAGIRYVGLSFAMLLAQRNEVVVMADMPNKVCTRDLFGGDA